MDEQLHQYLFLKNSMFHCKREDIRAGTSDVSFYLITSLHQRCEPHVTWSLVAAGTVLRVPCFPFFSNDAFSFVVAFVQNMVDSFIQASNVF